MTELRIYARDLDGTGSMHVCSKGDPGAVEFVPINAVEEAVDKAAHEAIKGYLERTDRFSQGVRVGLFKMKEAMRRALHEVAS